MRHRPTDYRDAYATAASHALMKAITRFFADNGIILPLGAAASLSTPMTHADAEFIVEVFAEFINGHEAV